MLPKNETQDFLGVRKYLFYSYFLEYMIIFSKWEDIILEKNYYLLGLNIPPVFSQDNGRVTGKMILRKKTLSLCSKVNESSYLLYF